MHTYIVAFFVHLNKQSNLEMNKNYKKTPFKVSTSFYPYLLLF